jgi:hypothetical protein
MTGRERQYLVDLYKSDIDRIEELLAGAVPTGNKRDLLLTGALMAK